MRNKSLRKTLFSDLEWIDERPKPFEFYTASELWTDEHTSAQMLAYHLNQDTDLASRKIAFIDQSVDWLVSRIGIAQGTKIADFGCGPGLYTSRLAQRGVDITGIDFSSRSIQYAKEQAKTAGLQINYLCQNYLDFETTGRFDSILLIFCDFCALSRDQREILLKKFHSFLKPTGHVVLDVHSFSAFDDRAESSRCEKNLLNGFWSAEPYYGFLNTFKYEEEKVTLDKYTIVERTRTRTIYNWLQYFSVESLSKEFHQAGLEIEEVFSDVTGRPYDAQSSEFAVIARKVVE